MIAVGEFNELKILEQTSLGLFLVDNEGEKILLPTKEFPKNLNIGDPITVFVYSDKADGKRATTLAPKILLHEFASLQVSKVTPEGAFLDWGLATNLFVPYKEQQKDMVIGNWYIVYLDIDEKDRLFASTQIDKQLQNIHITVKEGDQVDVMIYRQSDLGYNVIVNYEHLGLIFENEIFTGLNIGDKRKGYVKKIREDNKLDITLQPTGFRNVIDPNSDRIIKFLVDNNGFLPITDKSAPNEIYKMFGISKKAFKRSIGTLYRQRKISIESNGVKLIA